MGTRTDCLKLTLQPETQAHCRWGGLSLSTVSPAATPPQQKSVMVNSYASSNFSVIAGGPHDPVAPQGNAPSVSIDSYEPPVSQNPLPDDTQSPSAQIFSSLGQLALRLGIWATPTGFSTYTGRPISVPMEQWKNGGVPFPPGVENRLETGLRVYF